MSEPVDTPPPLVVDGARARIRAARLAERRRTAVLDDDPTGSQAVHGVAVVTVLERAQYAAALDEPGSTCFVLTNTRSLPQAQASALTAAVGSALLELGAGLDAPLDLVSRSDSTLRGHVHAEVAALHDARRALTGSGFDGVLFVPAYLEARRVTARGVHRAWVDGAMVPVGETEFARDATFGYSSSDLREFLAERSGGALSAGDVTSLDLEDIRGGGPDRVAEVLTGLVGGRWVVVDALEDADLDVVVLGLQAAQRAGGSFLHRTGPSFVAALAGIEPRRPLTTADVWGPRAAPAGHGLVVVGSHTGLTSRQVEAARRRGGLVEVELDVAAVADPARRDEHVARAGAAAGSALSRSDVLLVTSRELRRGADPDASLAIARATSAAVVEVVRAALPTGPAWVVAKGGITSHDVATEGLGIRRAVVLGQLLPGQVSVFDPVEAAPGVVGMPYVVFAGNVGDEGTLAHVVDVLRGRV